MHEEFDHDCPKKKAAWRRSAKTRNPKPVDKPGRADRLPRPARSGQACRNKPPNSQKAERRVSLPDWFRSALHEQAAGMLEASGDEEFDEEDCEHCQLPLGPVTKVTSCPDLSALDAGAEQVGNSTSTEPFLKRRASADAAVQCRAEEMLEPMKRSKLFQNQCLAALNRGVPCPSPYSVEAHFSWFEETLEYTLDLNDTELKALSERFLSPLFVGGIQIERDRREHNCWKVAERYVNEAVTLAKQSSAFRAGLVAGTRRLLLGSSHENLRGRCSGLLRLAQECPDMWAKLAYTALDFATRLIQAGALPKALIAEFLAIMITLYGGAPNASSRAGSEGWILGLVKVTPLLKSGVQRRKSYARPRRSSSGFSAVETRPRRSSSGLGASVAVCMVRRESLFKVPEVHGSGRLMRTRSVPSNVGYVTTALPGGCFPHKDLSTENSLWRTQTAPPRFTHSVGTSLRPHDTHQNNHIISYSGADASHVKAEIIPSEIEPCDLPDYWRHAAGGEHTPETLEKLASAAEDQLSAAVATNE
eukprot:TRINITY_DN4305_c1_g1_i1.p1 TRINITY_DN4305_c1_g1~~TRINITY_DN4305_c1_g1_i1.p1  ORF type:complete len:532 (-),score=64.80 TRINITY_DN4305_c1_g1_i1:80-1675(-)